MWNNSKAKSSFHIHILVNWSHYYTKSYAHRFKMGLRGGWPGCPPRLFEAGQPGQQPLTEAGAVKKLPWLVRINRDGCPNATLTKAVVIKQPPQLMFINRGV